MFFVVLAGFTGVYWLGYAFQEYNVGEIIIAQTLIAQYTDLTVTVAKFSMVYDSATAAWCKYCTETESK